MNSLLCLSKWEGNVVNFRYAWEHPQGANWASGECPPERCHWWRFETQPDGDVALVDEGGALLPNENKDGG